MIHQQSIFKPFLTALVMSGLTACASLNPPQGKMEELYLSPGVMQLVDNSPEGTGLKPQEDERVVCSRYRPTGSHRPILRCQTKVEYNKVRRDSEAYIDSMRTSSRR